MDDEFTPAKQRFIDLVHEIERTEGRIFVHPYEGRGTAMGTATLGLEMIEQAPELDTVIVPIGGGGLAAGVSTAVKMLRPIALHSTVRSEPASAVAPEQQARC